MHKSGIHNDVVPLISRYVYDYNMISVLQELRRETESIKSLTPNEKIKRCRRCNKTWTYTRTRVNPFCYGCLLKLGVWE